jgi:cytochrome c oxidase cbb3-type subunit 4
MSATTFGWVAGISTLVSMLAFLGVVAWSYSARRRADFAAAAALPLEEDAPTAPGARS